MPLPLLTSHRGNHALSGAQQERYHEDETRRDRNQAARGG